MPATQLLKKGFLFQNFTAEELENLASLARERRFKAGEFVFTEGSQADSMFVIETGSVEILKSGAAGTSLVVAQLSIGTHFGEMAFVDRAPRAAGAVTKGEAKLLEIRYDDLERIVATQPAVGLKLYHSIARTLCERIRRTTSDLSHLLLS
jgi:CRP-like cAMP-binding protein